MLTKLKPCLLTPNSIDNLGEQMNKLIEITHYNIITINKTNKANS